MSNLGSYITSYLFLVEVISKLIQFFNFFGVHIWKCWNSFEFLDGQVFWGVMLRRAMQIVYNLITKLCNFLQININYFTKMCKLNINSHKFTLKHRSLYAFVFNLHIFIRLHIKICENLHNLS